MSMYGVFFSDLCDLVEKFNFFRDLDDIFYPVNKMDFITHHFQKVLYYMRSWMPISNIHPI